MLPLLPSYWALVRDEADYLIEACGAAAGDYAAVEADESLSPAWTAFMRRVRSRILRQQRKGKVQASESVVLRPIEARS
jgi:hypothetical protein